MVNTKQLLLRARLGFSNLWCVRYSKALVFSIRLKQAKREADYRRGQTGQKMLVLCVCGRPVCVSKRRVKELLHEGFYKKGTKAEDIEKLAIYKTV